MRALAAFALLLASAGCGATRACEEGTVLVTITLAGAAVDANQVAVSVTVDGMTKTTLRPRTAGETTGTVRITFPNGYPPGKNITVHVAARAGGAGLGEAPSPLTPDQACAPLTP